MMHKPPYIQNGKPGQRGPFNQIAESRQGAIRDVFGGRAKKTWNNIFEKELFLQKLQLLLGIAENEGNEKLASELKGHINSIHSSKDVDFQKLHKFLDDEADFSSVLDQLLDYAYNESIGTSGFLSALLKHMPKDIGAEACAIRIIDSSGNKIFDSGNTIGNKKITYSQIPEISDSTGEKVVQIELGLKEAKAKGMLAVCGGSGIFKDLHERSASAGIFQYPTDSNSLTSFVYLLSLISVHRMVLEKQISELEKMGRYAKSFHAAMNALMSNMGNLRGAVESLLRMCRDRVKKDYRDKISGAILLKVEREGKQTTRGKISKLVSINSKGELDQSTKFQADIEWESAMLPIIVRKAALGEGEMPGFFVWNENTLHGFSHPLECEVPGFSDMLGETPRTIIVTPILKGGMNDASSISGFLALYFTDEGISYSEKEIMYGSTCIVDAAGLREIAAISGVAGKAIPRIISQQKQNCAKC